MMNTWSVGSHFYKPLIQLQELGEELKHRQWLTPEPVHAYHLQRIGMSRGVQRSLVAVLPERSGIQTRERSHPSLATSRAIHKSGDVGLQLLVSESRRSKFRLLLQRSQLKHVANHMCSSAKANAPCLPQVSWRRDTWQ